MMLRTFIFFLICIFVSSCGFKPMYKKDGRGIELDTLSINFKGNITYEIKEELKSFIGTEQENKDYVVIVEVQENMVPVIINENGICTTYPCKNKACY